MPPAILSLPGPARIRTADGWGVYAQRYNSAGVAQGGEFRVNTNTANDQVHASIAMDDAGNFVIAWAQDKMRRQLGDLRATLQCGRRGSGNRVSRQYLYP